MKFLSNKWQTALSVESGLRDPVDADGEVVDVHFQTKRDRATAKHFFKLLLRNNGDELRKVVTDKLRG